MNSERLNSWLNIALATTLGVVLFVGSYLVVVSKGHEAYGLVIFLLMPLVVGIAIGAIGKRGLNVFAALLLTIILSLGLMVLVGFEGWICCLMALPLLVVPMGIGGMIGYFAYGRGRDRKKEAKKTALVLLIACPFLMAAAGEVERPWRNVQRFETFTSEIRVSTPPDEVWERLTSMPSMDGDKPFLLKIGLPVPLRCTLDREAVGGKRTCFFDLGEIEMKITNWRRPNSFDMQITGTSLPGRHWLSFIDAGYELIPDGDGTRIVRHTTIGSRLYPRWYWRPLEAWGVRSEHAFVLSSVAKSID
jgi:hypothetical protein